MQDQEQFFRQLRALAVGTELLGWTPADVRGEPRLQEMAMAVAVQKCASDLRVTQPSVDQIDAWLANRIQAKETAERREQRERDWRHAREFQLWQHPGLGIFMMCLPDVQRSRLVSLDKAESITLAWRQFGARVDWHDRPPQKGEWRLLMTAERRRNWPL